MLNFVRVRQVAGVENYKSDAPWIGDIPLTTNERAQLVHVIRLLDPSLDEQTILTGPFTAFKNANGVAEVPLEWWDVEEDGKVRYQLWIYCVDAAQLFDAGTTTSVAYVSQLAFWGEGYKGDRPGSLADQLDRAQKAAVAEHRKCELRRIAFIER